MLAFLVEHRKVQHVIDPCAGWGERMLACAHMGVAYEGVDVNAALAGGYDRMISELGLSGASFCVKDAADANFGDADAVITCPPYLDIETYSEKGAENLGLAGFASWWFEVVSRCVESGCRWFCITTNQACRDTFVSAIEAVGFSETSATPVGKSRASHFNRKRGGVSTKREFEEFIVFERNGLGE
jgi:tRNA G10  N-methylase Trm11